jgi:UDP:flavonoid glycosyltransferase YjiC (YdhE family)
VTETGLRLAVQRALATPSLRDRTRALAAWAASHDPGTRAAELVEELAVSSRSAADPSHGSA